MTTHSRSVRTQVKGGQVQDIGLTQNEIAKIGVTPIKGGPIPLYILIHSQISSSQSPVSSRFGKKDVPLDSVPSKSLLDYIDSSSVRSGSGSL
jgi:hypothetical protein